MFRFFFKNDFSVTQGQVIDNYNNLATVFKHHGVLLNKLDEEGVCKGLSLNYLLFAHENRRDEYYRYITYIASLTTEKIEILARRYKRRMGKRELVIAGTGGDIKVSRLLEFLKVVSDAQENQTAKVIRTNWDKTQFIFCHKRDLARELEKADIGNGKLMAASMGRHIFAIEKIAAGFYLMEPNNIERKPVLIKTIQALADAILDNMTPHISSNPNIGLSIFFYSYGDTNRLLDDLIFTLQKQLARENMPPAFTHFIKQYHAGKLSRGELALVLHDVLNKQENLTAALIDFDRALIEYMNANGITQAQIFIDEQLQTNHNFKHGKAYKASMTSLHFAAHDNQLTLMKKLLAHDANPNRVAVQNISPLFLAAQEGFTEAINLLLMYGTEVDLASIDGVTPLFIATQEQHLQVMAMLLERGANPEHNIKDGTTPLIMAAQLGFTEGVKLLLKYGAAANKAQQNGATALLMAVQEGHLETMTVLLANHADANQMTPLGTPLIMAIQNQSLQAVKILLAHGANPGTARRDGVTALTLAAYDGQTAIVNLLLRHNADSNQTTAKGTTPLFIAAQRGHLDIVSILLKHGARLDLKVDGSVDVLLEQADKIDRLEEIENLILKNKLSKTVPGLTALYAAVIFGQTQIAALLIEKGAEPFDKTQGFSAHDFARALNQQDMLALLEQNIEIQRPIPK